MSNNNNNNNGAREEQEELLIYCKLINTSSRKAKKIVAMTWIDYKKAPDMFLQNRIVDNLKMCKISVKESHRIHQFLERVEKATNLQNHKKKLIT